MKLYVNTEIDIDKIIIKYKNKVILIIKRETCPDKATSHN